jgi:hypothetical protein
MLIPDDLLDWGKMPENAIRFARPWATEISDILARKSGTLGPRDCAIVLARLEALCAEAVRYGRADLLGGLDTMTAEQLGLVCAFGFRGRRIGIGRGQRYTWGEMRSILANEDTDAALAAVEQAKDLLEGVFPAARVSAVSDTHVVEKCSSCGTDESQVMMRTEHGSALCGPCWQELTEERVGGWTKLSTARRGR